MLWTFIFSNLLNSEFDFVPSWSTLCKAKVNLFSESSFYGSSVFMLLYFHYNSVLGDSCL